MREKRRRESVKSEVAERRLPGIRGFFAAPMSGQEIEERSLEIIDRQAPPHDFTRQEWEVVRRMIHTSGDFTLMDDVQFSKDAILSAVKALQCCSPIYADSNMIRSGLSMARLRSICRGYGRDHIFCHIADRDVARQAEKTHLPRSLFAVRKAKPVLDGAIALFGNAPIALLELNRLIIEENVRPSVIVAMPVGFVHVVESKEELLSLGVPCITLMGRRGGSPLAVSVIHALCTVAAQIGGVAGKKL